MGSARAELISSPSEALAVKERENLAAAFWSQDEGRSLRRATPFSCTDNLKRLSLIMKYKAFLPVLICREHPTGFMELEVSAPTRHEVAAKIVEEWMNRTHNGQKGSVLSLDNPTLQAIEISNRNEPEPRSLHISPLCRYGHIKYPQDKDWDVYAKAGGAAWHGNPSCRWVCHVSTRPVHPNSQYDVVGMYSLNPHHDRRTWVELPHRFERKERV